MKVPYLSGWWMKIIHSDPKKALTATTDLPLQAKVAPSKLNKLPLSIHEKVAPKSDLLKQLPPCGS